MLEYPRLDVFVSSSGREDVTLLDPTGNSVGPLTTPVSLLPLSSRNLFVHADPATNLAGLVRSPIVWIAAVVAFFMFGMPLIWSQLGEEDLQSIQTQRAEASYKNSFTPLKRSS